MSLHTAAAPINFLSVVVATYNRATALRRCLDSLLSMRTPDGLAWELICVDNNSTDETRRVIEEVARTSPVPVKYVFEQRQGVAYARNAGLREARGEIIAITDDDCIADPTWIAALMQEFAADPSLGIVGGRIELYDPRDRPIAIRVSRDRTFFSLGAIATHVITANMAIRRSAMEKVGSFDENFGPGARLLAGEDIDLLYRAYKAGVKILYSPDAVIYHNHGRQTESDEAKLRRAYAIGTGAFYCKHIFRRDPEAMRLAYWEVRRLLKRATVGVERAGIPTDNIRQIRYLTLGALHYSLIRVGGMW